jgi:hypothetical protein
MGTYGNMEKTKIITCLGTICARSGNACLSIHLNSTCLLFMHIILAIMVQNQIIPPKGKA